jgi:hypothetical protein
VRSRPGMARTTGDAWLGKKSRHLKTRASGEGTRLRRRAGAVRAGVRRHGAERGAVPAGSKHSLWHCLNA